MKLAAQALGLGLDVRGRLCAPAYLSAVTGRACSHSSGICRSLGGRGGGCFACSPGVPAVDALSWRPSRRGMVPLGFLSVSCLRCLASCSEVPFLLGRASRVVTISERRLSFIFALLAVGWCTGTGATVLAKN